MLEWALSASVLILFLIGLRFLLNGRISPRLQYALWLLVLLRLLIPVNLFHCDIGFFHASAQAIGSMQTQIAEPIAFRGNPQQEEAGPVQNPDREANTDSQNAEEGDGKSGITVTLKSVFTIVWLTGAGVMGLILFLSNLRFCAELRSSRRAVPDAECCCPVYLTGAADTPCIVGLFRPSIYVTQETVGDCLTLAHVLAHEQAHFRHGDPIWALLRSMCLVLHWYNPLVWIAAGLSRQDGELACDAAAVAELGEDQRTAYGKTLIRITCRKQKAGSMLLTATTMTCGKALLRERIRRIAKAPQMTGYTRIAVVFAAVLAAACTFTGAGFEEFSRGEAPGSAALTQPFSPSDAAGPSGGVDSPPDEWENDPLPSETVLDENSLTAFQTLFTWKPDNPWYSMALTNQYAKPEDVDIHLFFYNGIPGRGASAHKLPVSEMDEILTRYFGLSLEQTNGVGLDALLYDGAADSYYDSHGDFATGETPNMRMGYLREDGTIVLYYTFGDMSQMMILTLRPWENGYQILSNIPSSS